MEPTRKQWEAFFEVLHHIVDQLPGSWEDKKQAMLAKAEELDSREMVETNLEEMSNWFAE
jgi:hypothetical protein